MSSCAPFSNVCCLNNSGFYNLSEKDTMDVWCNGQKMETTVSYFLNHGADKWNAINMSISTYTFAGIFVCAVRWSLLH